jgi:hypothetical protein
MRCSTCPSNFASDRRSQPIVLSAQSRANTIHPSSFASVSWQPCTRSDGYCHRHLRYWMRISAHCVDRLDTAQASLCIVWAVRNGLSKELVRWNPGRCSIDYSHGGRRRVNQQGTRANPRSNPSPQQLSKYRGSPTPLCSCQT